MLKLYFGQCCVYLIPILASFTVSSSTLKDMLKFARIRNWCSWNFPKTGPGQSERRVCGHTVDRPIRALVDGQGSRNYSVIHHTLQSTPFYNTARLLASESLIIRRYGPLPWFWYRSLLDSQGSQTS